MLAKADQFLNAEPRVVALLKFVGAKDVRLEQPNQALVKFVPSDVIMPGKPVRSEQLLHAEEKLVTLPVLRAGNVPASDEQSAQALETLVTSLVSKLLSFGGNESRFEQFCHAFAKLTAPLSVGILIDGNEVIEEHPRHACE